MGIIILVLLVIGGMSGKMYMDKKEREEKQLIEWERVAAKQIKNTFEDVKEIRFDKDSIDRNWLSGYTGVDVYIYYENGKKKLVNISLPCDEKKKQLSSYGAELNTKEGATKNKIKVIYTNGKIETL